MTKYRHYSDEEKLKLITECRQSGLSDYQWCHQNNIPASTFYNWIVKLRDKACAISEKNETALASAVKQEVVKVNIVEETPLASPVKSIIKNNISEISVEIELNDCNVKIYNNASQEVISNVISVLRGGLC